MCLCMHICVSMQLFAKSCGVCDVSHNQARIHVRVFIHGKRRMRGNTHVDDYAYSYFRTFICMRLCARAGSGVYTVVMHEYKYTCRRPQDFTPHLSVCNDVTVASLSSPDRSMPKVAFGLSRWRLIFDIRGVVHDYVHVC